MITLERAKQHLRVTHESEDDLIQVYIDAAHAWILRYTGEGYDEYADELVAAELLLIGHFYANREAVNVGSSGSSVSEMPFAVEALAGPFRLPTIT